MDGLSMFIPKNGWCTNGRSHLNGEYDRIWRFPGMGVPPSRWMLQGKYHLSMDDQMGYPHDELETPIPKCKYCKMQTCDFILGMMHDEYDDQMICRYYKMSQVCLFFWGMIHEHHDKPGPSPDFAQTSTYIWEVPSNIIKHQGHQLSMIIY